MRLGKPDVFAAEICRRPHPAYRFRGPRPIALAMHHRRETTLPGVPAGLQRAAERVAVERVAQFEVFIEHGVALMPAELLEAGGVDATVHAGGQRAALEAVAAERARIEAGGGGAALDDAGDSAGIDRRAADHGAGQGGLVGLVSGWRPPVSICLPRFSQPL
jgi:hypothetical protein